MSKHYTDLHINNDMDRFNLIKSKYENLALSSFEWQNLPYGIKSHHIERALYQYGQAVFYNSKDFGLLCLPCSNGGKLNVYGSPLKVIATGYGFTEMVDLKAAVRIKNNPKAQPTEIFINQYAKDMLVVEESLKANIKQQRFPYAFFCDEKTRLSMMNIYKKIENGDPVIYLNKDLSMEDIQFFNTTAPYVADKLRQERYELEREILTFLGLNNNFEKSERLLVDEVNSNNDFIIRNAELMFEQRKKACEEINEMFGLNISVINKNAPKDLSKEEEDING